MARRKQTDSLTLPLALTDEYETAEQREWFAQQFESLTSELKVVTPSQWAEDRRYLTAAASAVPGPYRYRETPYLREIVDCLAVDSPIREVTLMKGVQIGATTGFLENGLGYFIEHVQNAPCMLVTADAELAKIRIETSIIPMLQLSGLEHLIKSSDETNKRKTGRTDKKIEWYGGGFLIPLGAQNANKLRSIPIRILLRDEVDAWPPSVGKDGDPMKLSFDRTAAFETTRKVANVSTPLIKHQSHIESRFLQGDQRRYFVRCVKCGFPQVLRWRVEKPNGEVAGMWWDVEDGNLVPGSVRYLCAECGHPHTNEDKTRLLATENGAEWKPTAVPADPLHRSYHLPALYSPASMQSWEACVQKYLEGWDIKRNRLKDSAKFQVFYNNVLAETYEQRGDRVKFDAVSSHRRAAYHFGQIPNKFASQFCGSHVLLLTCAVDVHKDNLAVAVFGWCRDMRAILINYWRFEGDCEELEDKNTWGRLRELIEQKEYVADDGKKYRIATTVIDSGYLPDQVYRFCHRWEGGVYPIRGRERHASAKTFSEFKVPNGVLGFNIIVDHYKDRWSAALKREWDGVSLQPFSHFNAPQNIREEQLKELTVETKRPKAATRTGQESGFEWHRPAGARNELWDLLVYNNAALEMLALDWSRNELEIEGTNFVAFYDYLQQLTTA